MKTEETGVEHMVLLKIELQCEHCSRRMWKGCCSKSGFLFPGGSRLAGAKKRGKMKRKEGGGGEGGQARFSEGHCQSRLELKHLPVSPGCLMV